MPKPNRIPAFAFALGCAISVPMLAVAAATSAQDALKAQAKVSEADARKTALDAVGNATVQSVGIDNGGGKLVWSFDLRTPNSPNVVEVVVDATTGQIISKQFETPTADAKEAQADKPAKR
jgi:hypothetical protein